MTRRMLLVVGSVAVMMLAGGIAAGGADKNGPETTSIDGIKGEKGAVQFPHRKHQTEFKNVEGKTIECVTCHHTSKGDAKPQACKSCHVADGEAQKEHDGKKAPFFATMKSPGKADFKTVIFHKRCLEGCHKEKAKADPALKKITKCENCHKK